MCACTVSTINHIVPRRPRPLAPIAISGFDCCTSPIHTPPALSLTVILGCNSPIQASPRVVRSPLACGSLLGDGAASRRPRHMRSEPAQRLPPSWCQRLARRLRCRRRRTLTRRKASFITGRALRAQLLLPRTRRLRGRCAASRDLEGHSVGVQEVHIEGE